MPPNGWIKANNKIIANNTKNTGFKNLPIYSKILDGFLKKPCNHKEDEAKINKYKVICFGDKMAKMQFQMM